MSAVSVLTVRTDSQPKVDDGVGRGFGNRFAIICLSVATPRLLGVYGSDTVCRSESGGALP